MGELKKLPNIADELEKQLESVGVFSQDDLRKIGSRECWLRIKDIDESACLNRLYALEGAINGIRWHDLDNQIKAQLKKFYNEHK